MRDVTDMLRDRYMAETGLSRFNRFLDALEEIRARDSKITVIAAERAMAEARADRLEDALTELLKVMDEWYPHNVASWLGMRCDSNEQSERLYAAFDTARALLEHADGERA